MARIDFQMNFTANKTSLNEILTMLKQIQNEASKTNLSDGLNNDLKEVGYYILYDKNEAPIYISDNQLEALAASYQNGRFQLEGWEKQYVMSEYTLFQNTLKLVSVVDLQKKHERFREVMETLMFLGLGVVSL